MKYVFTVAFFCVFFTQSISASFLYQEIDPICSISGTTHTSFPGEISDTSTWSIPKAYDGVCDETPELSQNEKQRIYEVMNNFFKSNNYYEIMPGRETTLNRDGQNFINTIFFPAVINYINLNRDNTESIATLNYAVKTIGYDYFVNIPNQ